VRPAFDKETLKYIGGFLIVAAAALIMFPGFLQVALGLSRILLIVVIAGGSCLCLAIATRRIIKLKAGEKLAEASSNAVITNTQQPSATAPVTPQDTFGSTSQNHHESSQNHAGA
jgi:hypothetical protein